MSNHCFYEIYRSANRGHLQNEWLEAHLSFNFANFQQSGREHFGALRVLNEDFVQPSRGFEMHPHENMEIVLIPLAGTVQHRDSLGNQIDVEPGELLVMRAGRGIEHSQINLSVLSADHHLQLWFYPRNRDAKPSVKWLKFTDAEREGRWQLWASGHGEHGALEIDSNARVFRSRIARGTSLFSPTANESGLYLHVICGSISFHTDCCTVASPILSPGDAIAWPRSFPFRLEAKSDTPSELLLIDLGES